MALLTQPFLGEPHSPQGSTVPPTSVPPTSTRGATDGSPSHDRMAPSHGVSTPTSRNGRYQHPSAQMHNDLFHDIEECQLPSAGDSQITALLHCQKKEVLEDSIRVIVDAPAADSSSSRGPPLEAHNSAPVQFDDSDLVTSGRAFKSTTDLMAPPSLRDVTSLSPGEGPLTANVTSKKGQSMQALKSIKRLFRQGLDSVSIF